MTVGWNWGKHWEFKLMLKCKHLCHWACSWEIGTCIMDQFRNDVALWVNKLRGRYDAIFIEPENVNKISWAVEMPNICIICHRTSRKFKDINFIPFLRNLKYEKNDWKPLNWLKTIWKRQVEFALFISLLANVRKKTGEKFGAKSGRKKEVRRQKNK